jgi:hypothetical protein
MCITLTALLANLLGNVMHLFSIFQKSLRAIAHHVARIQRNQQPG